METNEDMKLAAGVRAALEEGASLGADRRQCLLAAAAAETRRRRLHRLVGHWTNPALLAASLAVSLAFVAVFSEQGRVKSKDGMTDAIGLLCELDGVADDGLMAESPGELLLVWQEAPCADLFL